MLKKTITYTDYNDQERTEDFYFNLNKAELAELELSVSGGLSEMIKKIIAEENTPEIMKMFKKLLLMSYGEKSEDGRRFIKSEELTEAFTQTEAYSQLFFELGSNAEEAANFINGIIPKDI